MNKSFEKLFYITQKSERLIIGLMSGTSVDGLDIALCRIRGAGRSTSLKVEFFTSVAYENETRNSLINLTRSAVTDPCELVVWHDHLARVHAQMINSTLESRGINHNDVDLIASHGHTFYHAPQSKHRQIDKSHATMQIGDGDQLAHNCGIITISDFRQMDIARGGEGAPLAGYGDWLLFSDDQKDRVLLNIGGIANLTWLPAGSDQFPPLSYDTGPGNTLMDAAMREFYPELSYDNDAAIARKGTVDRQVLKELKSEPYFKFDPPKTTGYETFNMEMIKKAAGLELSPQDLLATLNRFTAETIAEEITLVWNNPEQTEVFVSGGGLHNPLLMESLAELLQPAKVESSIEIGLDPDAKEAAVFALLANELVAGDDPRMKLGKISLCSE